MARKIWLLFALFALGCDDATVHANFVDYFLCSYMPSWMGDCQSTDTRAKVESVLTHGLVSAEIECPSVYFGLTVAAGDPVAGWWKYQATKLQDGSCFASAQQVRQNYTVGGSGSRFSARGSDDASDCAVEVFLPSVGGTLRVSASSGDVIASDDYCPSNCSSDISESCAGFNLAAFGVAP